MAKTAEENSKVEINYTLKLEDGSLVDSNEGKDPFSFVAGGEGVIKGISTGVIGMSEGETKNIEVEPAEGYGEPREDLVVKIPLDKLPEGVKQGDLLSDGQSPAPWKVMEVNEEDAVVDGNHPLAGKKLLFEVELLTVADPE